VLEEKFFPSISLTSTDNSRDAKIFPEVPTPTAEGVKTLLDDLAPRNPKAQVADPKCYVDFTFVREVESSGFIKHLYGK